MPENYTTKYIFELEIQGKKMAEDAQKIYQDAAKNLAGGTVEVQKQTAAQNTLNQTIKATTAEVQKLSQAQQ